MSKTEVKRTIFQDAKQHPNIGPVALYQMTINQFHQNDRKPHNYFSGPITSGGAIRIKELDLPEIVKLNTNFAYVIIDSLIKTKQVEGYLTVPHDIGVRHKLDSNQPKKWGEVDYMTFWLMYLMRLSFDKANLFSSYITSKIDFNIFNNYNLGREVRKEQYDNMLRQALLFANKHHKDVKPIDNLVALPDSSMSLGATVEQSFATEMGVKTFDVTFGSENIEDRVFQQLLGLDLITLNNDAQYNVELRKRAK